MVEAETFESFRQDAGVAVDGAAWLRFQERRRAAHGDKLLDSYWSGLLSHRTEPTLLLDDAGCALRVSDGLLTLLACDDALDLVTGRLRAALACEDARLRAMLDAAVAAVAPRSGAMRVSRRSARASLVLTVYPLPRAGRALEPAEAAARVTVVDPAGAASAAHAVWREAFEFSARECQVAALLMAGHSVESTAAALDISEATARVHLRRLLAKTDTSRQSELVRLLSRVG